MVRFGFISLPQPIGATAAHANGGFSQYEECTERDGC
jgi:hypothetical protein